MLYAFFGTDEQTVREKANARIKAEREKGAEVVRIASDNYAPEMIESAVGSASLFGLPQVVVLDTPSALPEMYERCFGLLDALAQSVNTVVLIERKLLAPEKKKLQKYAASCDEYAAESAQSFNTFALADALVRRDKKNLWVLLMQAKAVGIGSEEIIGTLFWQLKALRLAEKTDSAAEAGQKPFVHTKAKRALSQFKAGELERLSAGLLRVYHDGHAGRRNIDVALERWALAL